MAAQDQDVILSIGNFVEFPVSFEFDTPGKKSLHKFFLTGKRLSVSEYRESLGISHSEAQPQEADQPTEGGQEPKQGKTWKDFLCENITGWRGQKLLISSQTNQPVDFTPARFEMLLDIFGTFEIIKEGYLAALISAQAPEARAKN